ncbi:proline-rich protein 11-like [Aplysia californica]|uniref:Proline-rich protein 11-like n=1 Tax=Aplysia californica TaxID=6500 RepID=A0ABM0JML3_APLCA|nr:proline-rich protein 11-like [Aplysia californica]
MPVIRRLKTDVQTKDQVMKKMRAVGGTLLPEITVEALRSVKLKRTGGPDLRSRINEDGNLSAKPLAPSNQPVVTLAALQRVSLRKTSHVVKSHGDCVEDDLSRKENENSGDSTMVDIRKVLKRTTLQRSPGGTPMTSKRTRC